MIGKKCIVRGHSSGVFFGEVVAIENNGDGRSKVQLDNCRRIWKWYGGLSLQDIAVNGVVASKSRISAVVDLQLVSDAIELMVCSEKAISAFESALADSAGKE